MRGQRAVPFLPAAASVQRGLYGDIFAEQPCDQAIGGRIDFQINIETVVIGHRIQFQDQPVTLERTARRVHHRAAVGDAGLALKRGDLFLSGNRLGEYDPVNL